MLSQTGAKNVCWASRRGVWEPYGRPSSLSFIRKIARYRSGIWNAALRPSKAPLTLEQYERCHILEVLRETNWRIEGPKGAALILGLHPNTLRSRMQKLGVRRPSADATLTSQSL